MFYRTFTNYPKNSDPFENRIFSSFQKGSSLTRLIYINCGIFLIIKVIYTSFLLSGEGAIFYPILSKWVAVPSNLSHLLTHFWTLGTYMFIQFDFLHLLFNMLWLYWFGTFFLNHFTQRQLTGVYLLGGIFGALLYIIAYNIFPYFDATRDSAGAIGASASVMAIVFAVCTYLPNHKVYIFLLGPIKLIYLALFTACIDFFSIQFDNAGGHIAHLGGALFGWLFIKGLQHNKDFSAGITYLLQLFVKLFSSKKKVRVTYKKQASDMNDQEYNLYKKQQQETINTILDKISKSGYESLTREEKEILFKRKD